jgi:hypothetical protein
MYTSMFLNVSFVVKCSLYASWFLMMLIELIKEPLLLYTF